MIPALELRNLSKTFDIDGGIKSFFGGLKQQKTAVDNVNIKLMPNSVLGLVGESGSGKSTCGLMAMRLLDVTKGNIFLKGTEITNFSTAELKPRRKQMQIVFQDNYASLNPMMTLSQIISEPFVIHGLHTRTERLELVADLLEKVGLGVGYTNRYPHELSGGQRQRVSIARALALKPDILVADEPTSALDVSVKAQVINLLHDLQAEMGLSVLFISHELNVIRSLADEVVVMYRGRVVEQAPTETIFQDARHPYTKELLNAIPSFVPRQRIRRTFMSPLQIAEAIPIFSEEDILPFNEQISSQPQLAKISNDHFVEAFIEQRRTQR
ncbi:MAG: ABC transporter ATP-binding protein [Tateyamaria sp.]|nr:ABC transporter ATP-binding protein [Tateyamaria sp.]MDA9949458.1 ATP-binding cassette domain-containing protein [Paracoccaceae bacterium]